jgi:dienelactone hydrolase
VPHNNLIPAIIASSCLIILTQCLSSADEPQTDVLPSTKPLDWNDDIASRLVDGADRFLLRELQASIKARADHWTRDLSSADAYVESIKINRKELARILGVRDGRPSFRSLELAATTEAPALVGIGAAYKIYAVRWPAVRDIHGEGLLLEPVLPANKKPVANIVAIPDADQSPEMIVGLVPGVAPESQFARRLAESGCRVIVPTLISRKMQRRAPPGQGGRANLTNREYLYRSAYELGRHLIGYELQKIFAAVDWFSLERQSKGNDPRRSLPIGVIGYGEGGMLALYAAALNTRIDAACVSGYFDSRQKIWQQPIDRNVFALLEQFGDAEVATLIAPRTLIVEQSTGPDLSLPSEGGAPAVLLPPEIKSAEAEFQRASGLTKGLTGVRPFSFVASGKDGKGPNGSDGALNELLIALRHPGDRTMASPPSREVLRPAEKPPKHLRAAHDPAKREQRQMHEIDAHNQWLLSESPYVRREFMKRLDKSSLEKYAKSAESYREIFRHEVVGHFDNKRLPLNPRSRKAYDNPTWTGYEVVLDVFPDVIAYGILCVPKDLKKGEKRPVVVCQHGLEGRPQDVVSGDHRAYHDFAAKLAERGFVTFSPQNLYIFRDRFRTLQRKAYPLKKTIFSIMVPQHQRIVDWLKTLPHVDSDRIAFYGLSYGGKSAMRIPALVTDYCLSICSADFNEWVWKNASTRAGYSYVWTGEYEIFEFDLGSTFNYAEMAALIAPRPFMVERGHFDGVAPDEAVAYEFAKVRHLYQARLGIGDRCELEWFVGPHTINGKGTFAFLHKHLKWPNK